MGSSSRVDTIFDDTDLKIGFGRALGISLEKLSEICGVAVSTISRRVQEIRVQRAESIGRMMVAQQGAKIAEDVARSASERMKGVFDKSFQLTERLIKKAESMGDDISLETLMDIHKNLTVWATRYTLSEAPKRIQMSGGQIHAHVFIGSLKEAENIIRTRDMLGAAAPAIEGAIDVEPTN